MASTLAVLVHPLVCDECCVGVCDVGCGQIVAGCKGEGRATATMCHCPLEMCSPLTSPFSAHPQFPAPTHAFFPKQTTPLSLLYCSGRRISERGQSPRKVVAVAARYRDHLLCLEARWNLSPCMKRRDRVSVDSASVGSVCVPVLFGLGSGCVRVFAVFGLFVWREGVAAVCLF
jgi:hypothetical protein